MAKQTEIVSRWIDAQPEGALLRSNLGKQVIEIRRAPRWMLVLGDSLAGDVVRALEWLGPDLAETTVGKLVGRIGRDDWNAVLETRTHLPAWMVVAIQKGLPASALVPFRR